MSYIDTSRPAPFGAVTIYRAVSLVSDAGEFLLGRARRRARALAEFSPSHLEDMGLSVADMPARARNGVVADVLVAVREWNARRRTVAELSRLSDAQLDDIGLTRGHVESLRLGYSLT